MLNRSAESKRQFADAKNWYKDRYQYVLVWRNMLFFISIIALAALAMCTLIISRMAPLKTVEPFVIQVDEKTGMTQVVNPMGIQELNVDNALDRYFISQYVRARESYDAIATEFRANSVRLMSTSDLYNSYYSTINPNDPNSLYVRFNTRTVRVIKLSSIVFLDRETAQVRMIATDSGKETGQHHLLATLKFQYTKMQLSTEERYINPLGFRVTMYNLTEESL